MRGQGPAELSGAEAPRSPHLAMEEKVVILGLMTSVTFGTFFADGLIPPLVPLELDSLGLHGQLLAGFVYAAFPLAILVLSPLSKAVAGRRGRVPLLYAGIPLQAVAVLLFALATRRTHTAGWVVARLLLCRAAQGFGAAMANLAVFAIVAEAFPEDLGKAMGLNEGTIGLATLLGPLIGTPLYSWGGFIPPFLVGSGTIWLSLLFVVVYHRHSLSKTRDFMEDSRHSLENGEAEAGSERVRIRGGSFDGDTASSVTTSHLVEGSPASQEMEPQQGRRRQRNSNTNDNNGQEPSFWAQVRSVLSWRLALSALILFFSYGTLGWVKTILSLHLRDDLAFEDKYIGIAFAAINLPYLVCGPLAGALADRCGYKPVMTGGLTLTGLVIVLMGGVVGRAGGLENRQVWQVALLACFGASAALAVIPTLAAMKESAPGVMGAREVDTVVMIFSQCQQGGLVMSALLSGALSTAIGWTDTMLIYGALCLGVGVASSSLFYCRGSIQGKERREEAESSDKLAPLLGLD